MKKIIEGILTAEGRRFGIVISRFNEFITTKLLEGALDALYRHGAVEDNIDVVRVPGSFEIPQTALKMARSKKYDAIICLGAVIRGGTPHFEYVATEVSKGIAQAGFETGTPTIFGIIIADNLEQAIERAGTKGGNKGWDAAITAIEMADLYKSLKTKKI